MKTPVFRNVTFKANCRDTLIDTCEQCGHMWVHLDGLKSYNERKKAGSGSGTVPAAGADESTRK